MRKLLLIAVCLLPWSYCSAQTYNFPRAAASDPAFLEKAMPVLATQALAVYKDENREKYLDNLFRLQMVAGKYQEALNTIGSLRELFAASTVIPTRAAWVNVNYEIFADAKIKQGAGSISFKDAYEQVFRKRFAQLADWPAAEVVRAYVFTDLADTQQSLQGDLAKQKEKDAITLPDALNLVSDYLLNQAYHDFAPLNPPLIAEDDARRYTTEANLLIKTPDGASICAFMMRPRGTERVTTLLNFSIYVGTTENILVEARGSAANGYAGVAAFTRGKGCSPDQPVAYLHDGEDAATVIDWISKQAWSDGRVGMYGGSYEGFTQWATAKHMPKALKAMMTTVPAAPGIDVPMEGSVFANFIYPWPFYTLDKKTDDDAVYGDSQRWNRLNHNWYTSGRAYRDLDKIDGTPNPTFDQWIAHPSYDAYWQAMIPYQQEFARATIPVLLTAGYYYGGPGAALYYYTQVDQYAPQGEHYLVVGPYHHFGAQVGVIGIQGNIFDTLGGMNLDPVAQIDITELRYQWFNYIFKGAPKPALLGGKLNYEVTGANVWKHAPSTSGMGNGSMRFYMSPTPNGSVYRFSPEKPPKSSPIELTVDLADHNDVDWPAVGGGVIDDAVDTHNGLEFVSDPLPESIEVSGLFSGRVDFAANKKDFDFEIDLYELTPLNKYVQLGEYWTRASYIRDRTKRSLLRPGKRQQEDFKSIRLISRKVQQGSRIVAVLTVIKGPDRQINYGTGKDVSVETIQDAASSLSIQWFDDSYIDLPTWK
jgi:hypothetical protein